MLLEINPENDALFQALRADLSLYECATEKAPHCTVTLKNLLNAPTLEDKAVLVRNYPWIPVKEYKGDKTKYLINENIFCIHTDFKKQSLSVNYSESQPLTVNAVKNSLKWLIIKTIENMDGIYAHASAVHFRDKVILFPGHAGSGKIIVPHAHDVAGCNYFNR